MTKKAPGFTRIHTFDIVKAIGVTLLILAHSLNSWLDPNSEWIEGLLYIILSPMGVPGFLFAAGLGFGFSWKNKENKGVTHQENVRYQMSRFYVFLVVSFVYNLVAVFIHGLNFANLWFWFILQTMAFARLLSIAMARLSKKVRILIAIAFIAITPVILDLLESYRTGNIVLEVVYYILFHPVTTDSIMFYYPVYLVGVILGEEIFTFTFNKEFGKLKKWFAAGIGCIVIGILIGLDPVGSENVWAWITEFQTHPDWTFTTIPRFFVRNSYPWITYSIGILIVLTIISLYILDYKKNIPKTTWFELYGRYSFTIYIGHYVCYLIPLQFDYRELGFAFLVFMIIIYIVVYSLHKRTKGRVSLEFLVKLGATAIYKKTRPPVVDNSAEIVGEL